MKPLKTRIARMALGENECGRRGTDDGSSGAPSMLSGNLVDHQPFESWRDVCRSIAVEICLAQLIDLVLAELPRIVRTGRVAWRPRRESAPPRSRRLRDGPSGRCRAGSCPSAGSRRERPEIGRVPGIDLGQSRHPIQPGVIRSASCRRLCAVFGGTLPPRRNVEALPGSSRSAAREGRCGHCRAQSWIRASS